jgi:hypothetical protein
VEESNADYAKQNKKRFIMWQRSIAEWRVQNKYSSKIIILSSILKAFALTFGWAVSLKLGLQS